MIINASPLIIFGKLNRIDILQKLYSQLIISEMVYDEVVLKGLNKQERDALIIKEYIGKDIDVVKLVKKFQKKAEKIKDVYGIDIGEAETIALALQRKEKEVVIDERAARDAANAVGIRPVGSLRVLLIAYRNKIITKAEIRKLIEEMENSKYRFSPQVLIEFWNILDKIKVKK